MAFHHGRPGPVRAADRGGQDVRGVGRRTCLLPRHGDRQAGLDLPRSARRRLHDRQRPDDLPLARSHRRAGRGRGGLLCGGALAVGRRIRLRPRRRRRQGPVVQRHQRMDEPALPRFADRQPPGRVHRVGDMSTGGAAGRWRGSARAPGPCRAGRVRQANGPAAIRWSGRRPRRPGRDVGHDRRRFLLHPVPAQEQAHVHQRLLRAHGQAGTRQARPLDGRPFRRSPAAVVLPGGRQGEDALPQPAAGPGECDRA